MIRLGFILDAHMHHATPESRMDNYAESMIAKLEWIAKQNLDAVFTAGDFFHKPTQPYPFQNRVMDVMRRIAPEVYLVIGNHDVPYQRWGDFDKTTTGNLLKMDNVRLLSENPFEMSYKQGGYTNFSIVGANLGQTPPPAKPGHFSVLVYHAFYMDARDDLVLTEEQVRTLNHDMIFLGHDHVEYPEMRIGKTLLCRPGSLSRATSHFYNRGREPKFPELTVCTQEGIMLNLLDVPCKPATEVFLDPKTPKKSLADHAEELQGVVQFITSQNLDKTDVHSILEKMQIDEDVRDFLKAKLSSRGSYTEEKTNDRQA